MEKKVKEISETEDTIKNLKIDEYIYNYINSIEKNIYHTMKEIAEKNNLAVEFHEYLLATSFLYKTNDKNIFKYLFNKLKEYSLSSTLLILIYTYDKLTDNFTDLETTICQAIIFSDNKTWYPNEDIDTNLSFNDLSDNTNKRIIQKYEALYKWFNDQNNVADLIKRASTDKRDIFDSIYKNLTAKLNHLFFAKLIPTFLTNELKLDSLPKSCGHFISLTCDIFYSKTFGANNIFHTCETCLQKINYSDDTTDHRIRNQEAIVYYYNDNLNKYYNLLKKLNNEENILESNVIYFNISRIFRQDFIASISSPIIKTLINP